MRFCRDCKKRFNQLSKRSKVCNECKIKNKIKGMEKEIKIMKLRIENFKKEIFDEYNVDNYEFLSDDCLWSEFYSSTDFKKVEEIYCAENSKDTYATNLRLFKCTGDNNLIYICRFKTFERNKK